MFKHAYVVVSVVALAMGVMASLAPSPALAASPEGLESDAQAALKSLYGSTPTAKTLGDAAKGIMVFPNIVKAGFIFGAQYGEGELLKRDQMAGIQGFAYAMFFMTDSALNYLENSAGFELGVGPNIVVVDAGMAKTITTTTGRDDVYAFIFGQKGLMAGIGLQGSKITRVSR